MKKPRQNRASSQRWALAFAVVAVGCGGADDAGLTGGNSDSEGGGTSSSGGAGSGGSNTGVTSRAQWQSSLHETWHRLIPQA